MDNPHANPAPGWISEQAWSHLCELDRLAAPFHGLRESVGGDLEGWRAVVDAAAPHEQAGPHQVPGALDPLATARYSMCTAA
jgi:dynein heavy chain